MKSTFVVVAGCASAVWGGASGARAGDVEMVSVTATGELGIIGTHSSAVSSGDGRYVAFTTQSGNLVPGQPPVIVAPHIVVKDMLTGAIEWVTKSASGQPANNQSSPGAFSADGRYLTVYTNATNLYPGIIGIVSGILVYDRQTQSFAPVSIGPNGEKPNSDSNTPTISADGRYVLFQSYASNLVAGDTNSLGDLFVRDMVLGVTQRVNVSATGQQDTTANTYGGAISADGRYVAFISQHPFSVSDSNGKYDAYRKDLLTGGVKFVSAKSTGLQTSAGVSWNHLVKISGDGSRIAFHSESPDFIAGDDANSDDIFVKDIANDVCLRATQNSVGKKASAASYLTDFSADGRFVLFGSDAVNLSLADVNPSAPGLKHDVFLHDLVSRITVVLNVTKDGVTSNFELNGYNGELSADGRYAVFFSDAPDLVAGDDNGFGDIFRVDTGFAEHGGGYDVLAQRPRLRGTGFPEALASGAITLTNAPPAAPAVLLVSAGYQNAPFPGGKLLTKAPAVSFVVMTDANGRIDLPFTLGAAPLPPYAANLQFAIAESSIGGGFILSNAIAGITR